ncbi:MAG: hypothetical protein QOF35_2041, partial [Actinomycetota bacterium]|nr:hypothetical protein [Actinomycetota bacterium]
MTELDLASSSTPQDGPKTAAPGTLVL